jgi:hypothetical protein
MQLTCWGLVAGSGGETEDEDKEEEDDGERICCVKMWSTRIGVLRHGREEVEGRMR